MPTDLQDALEIVNQFVRELPISEVPAGAVAELLHQAAKDPIFSDLLNSGGDAVERLSALFHVGTLTLSLTDTERGKKLRKAEIQTINRYCDSMISGEKPYQIAAREKQLTFDAFVERLIKAVLSGGNSGEQLRIL